MFKNKLFVAGILLSTIYAAIASALILSTQYFALKSESAYDKLYWTVYFVFSLIIGYPVIYIASYLASVGIKFGERINILIGGVIIAILGSLIFLAISLLKLRK